MSASSGTLVVTGASGRLGRLVAEHLIALRGGTTGIVLVSRRPEEVAAQFPGVLTRHGDFRDPDSLLEAFTGAERVLIISGVALDTRAQEHATAIESARRAGAGFVAYTSMLAPTEGNPALIAPSHRATEEHLRGSGLDHAVLRAGFYADFQVYEAAEAIRTGRVVHNRGTGRSSYLPRTDIARAAASVLAEGRGGIFELTGTRSLTAADLAAVYADVGGRPIETEDVDDDTLFDALAGSGDGHSQYGARLTVSIGQAIRAGYLDVVTDDVARLTGRAPEPIEETVARDWGALPRS